MTTGWTWLSFLICLAFYVPLIWLSNHSGLPPLAVLPVSTVSCCVASLFFITAFGWWRHLWGDRAARLAAWAASPATANIVLTSPAAYALATPAALLATLTVMKLGSIAVALPAFVAGVVATRRVRLAAWLCIATLGLAAYGKSFWSIAHGGPWLGGVLTAAGSALAGWYIGNYAWRIAKMAKFKRSWTFFVWEHLLAPHLALLFLLVGLGAVWLLDAFSSSSAVLDQIVLGFTLWDRWDLWLLGVCSQVVGLSGGWILIDEKVSAAAMTMYRCAAILAGTLLVAVQGCHFAPENSTALAVPFILVLLGSAKRQSA